MLYMDSYMKYKSYSFVAVIDYGNEVGVATYNDTGG